MRKAQALAGEQWTRGPCGSAKPAKCLLNLPVGCPADVALRSAEPDLDYVTRNVPNYTLNPETSGW